MRSRILAITALTAAAVALVAAQSAQTPPPPPQREQPAVTFKVEINYVEVDATVTDATGKTVRTLTKDDFEVVEDGKPQTITNFSLVDIPVERIERPLFRPTAIEPDVRTSTRGASGRIFVLVMDDLHTAPLRSQYVRRAARLFVERYIGDNDLAAVVYTGAGAKAGQEFTSSRRLLLQSIDKFMGRAVGSATLAKIQEYSLRYGTPAANDPLNDPLEAERAYQARSSLETLNGVSEYLGGVRGRRKAVVFFSEGIDYDINDWINNQNASTIIDETRTLVGTATRANVNIYSVDPRGLTGLGDEGIEVTGVGPEAPPDLGMTGLLNELRISQDSLRVLADETGGFAAVNSNDFGKAYARILDENSTYYVLGYYPTNDRRDGRFRKIEVRVKQPDLKVSARKGYVAPTHRAPTRAADATGTSVEVRDALDSPVPIGGLSLSAFAAPFKAAPNAAIVLGAEIPGRELAFTERNGRFVNDVELSYLAVDAAGKVQGGDRKELKLDLRPQTRDLVERYGLRVVLRFPLPPGRYQLRLAARESVGGRLGSLHYDVDVPDYASDPLMMSGLLITSAAASRVPTPAEDTELKQVLPAQPTTLREFVAQDQLALFAEIYDNRAATPHSVDITTTVRTDAGNEVFRTEDVRKSEEIKGARGGYGYTAQVPLKGLAPGLYVLKVEARSRLGGDPMVREVQFRVVSAPAGGAPQGS